MYIQKSMIFILSIALIKYRDRESIGLNEHNVSAVQRNEINLYMCASIINLSDINIHI